MQIFFIPGIIISSDITNAAYSMCSTD